MVFVITGFDGGGIFLQAGADFFTVEVVDGYFGGSGIGGSEMGASGGGDGFVGFVGSVGVDGGAGGRAFGGVEEAVE